MAIILKLSASDRRILAALKMRIVRLPLFVALKEQYCQHPYQEKSLPAAEAQFSRRMSVWKAFNQHYSLVPEGLKRDL